MILSLLPPKRSLSKSFLKQRPVRDEFNKFKNNLRILLTKIDIAEREENQKTHIRDFLVNTYYKDLYEINTKDYKDLVIHTGKSKNDKVGVIIETKRPGNKNEMISSINSNPNSKAFQELVLYYMNERIDEKNIDIKYCIATNINEWFIFDAAVFEKYFYRNKDFVRQYEEWKKGQKVLSDTNLFYNDIAKPFIDSITDEIPVTYFDLRDYEDSLVSNDPEIEKKLISLFKLLSPNHLLRISAADDSNKLDEKFYKELLQIIGLEEAKEGSKNIIRRKEKSNRDAGSLLENTISKLSILDSVDRVSDSNIYGDSKDDKNFNIALELCITWINRILFLKLLEAQLLYYHDNNPAYKFLNKEKLKDFDEVFSLFHHVLAVPSADRDPDVKKKFELIPYLNSTLFEISKLEKDAINISQLNDSLTLDLIGTTVLKDIKKNTKNLPALEYLLEFLDAYDFASESSEDIQESNKTLINASVLGKVFEKINGYKDGSIFTPGFITMYMCREAIRPAVVQKFRDEYKWNIESFDDLKNFIADKRNSSDIIDFNETVNSIKICDPAVGSGHFLVSSLNEIITVKSELGILADDKGSRLTDYDISIEQDELIITDRHGDIFEYKVTDAKTGNGFSVRPDIQKFQSTLFHEKQKIIENCLFGVDINQNSVKICRLRLWIELLKNAYYKPVSGSRSNESVSGSRSNEPPPGPLLKNKEGEHENVSLKYREGEVSNELETLPNIDINIKCGNSLISRFALDANLSRYGQNVKDIVEKYRENVRDYKNEKNRDKKKEIDKLIDSLKNDIRTTISKNDPKLLKLNKMKSELDNIENQSELFDQSKKDLKEKDLKIKKLQKEITKLNKELEDIRSNAIYRNAFEWRFEFPEVLNEDGEYEGFDVVIGNPPYISNWDLSKKDRSLVIFLENEYSPYLSGHWDIFGCFILKANQILKVNALNSFILPTSFYKEKHSKELRKFFLEKVQIIELIDFQEEVVFEGIARQTGVYLVKKNFANENEIRIKSNTSEKGLLIPQNFYTKLKNNSFKTSVSVFDISIFDKLNANSILLGNIVCINTGVVAHSKIDSPIKFKKEDVIHTDFQNGYKKYIVGSNLSQYNIIYKNEFIDYESKQNLFHRAKYPLLFESNKIIVRRISGNENKFIACYDENKYYTNDNIMHLIHWTDEVLKYQKPEKKWTCINESELSLKYLLAIINSKLNTYFFSKFLSTDTLQGTYSSIYPEDIRQIPIKNINQIEQQNFINLVDQILESKKQNKDTTSLEAEIDRMVYELYGLTEEEMKVVEGEGKNR